MDLWWTQHNLNILGVKKIAVSKTFLVNMLNYLILDYSIDVDANEGEWNLLRRNSAIYS